MSRSSRRATQPSLRKLLDIKVLLIGGRERTEEDLRKLFANAEFELTRIVAAFGDFA